MAFSLIVFILHQALPAVQSIRVLIAPTSANVEAGDTRQFKAVVLGSTDQKVSWEVNKIPGGNSAAGRIASTGLYTAPDVVPPSAKVTVTAVANADRSKSASAEVTITARPSNLSITPLSVTVAPGHTQQFIATVRDIRNLAVTWEVNGIRGGSPSVGTITRTGFYTAPGSIRFKTPVIVTASSQVEGPRPASATVRIPAEVSLTSFYVSTKGRDSNAGTLQSPWRTIQHAANTVQPGDTVYVRGGVYNESVNIRVSGSAREGAITFESYPGETTIVDGTRLAASGIQGLFNIVDQSFITIRGFEVRNYQTSNSSVTPTGIWITGAGTNIQILNNLVHNIVTKSEAEGSAFGIAVYGSDAPASIDNVTISGNQVYSLKTGSSESVNVDGNISSFTMTGNIVHDNDNIGMDAIGFEGVSPNPEYDYARNGLIAGNTIYNISAINNPGEGYQYDTDGIYVDGGFNITVEDNLIHNVDIGIEMASEHNGHVASFVTTRNNLVYHSNSAGISIGGYADNVGGTENCRIVNNTLLENDTKETGSGEFQIQYYATGNIFKNNIVYAGRQGLLINNFTGSKRDPADVNNNLYFSSAEPSNDAWVWNGVNYTGFESYRSETKKDLHSAFADPQFVNLNTPDLHVGSNSPALRRGVDLGVLIVGAVDFAGNQRARQANGPIDIGAYEHP
ncbi:MAG: DUF1565 domain-containing protein [Acidobacteriaceae bacterium]|nr:DUF1565 domain-containing protein [Acidobacteriaceae bacterium]